MVSIKYARRMEKLNGFCISMKRKKSICLESLETLESSIDYLQRRESYFKEIKKAIEMFNETNDFLILKPHVRILYFLEF